MRFFDFFAADVFFAKNLETAFAHGSALAPQVFLSYNSYSLWSSRNIAVISLNAAKTRRNAPNFALIAFGGKLFAFVV